jgi:hypothetical protein
MYELRYGAGAITDDGAGAGSGAGAGTDMGAGAEGFSGEMERGRDVPRVDDSVFSGERARDDDDPYSESGRLRIVPVDDTAAGV